MAETSLIIGISGISVTLDRFVNSDYPRIEANTNSQTIVYPASGAIVYSGVSYESKFLWDIQAYCTPAQEEYLDLIWAESDRLKGDGAVYLQDKTRPYREKSPRTRDTATGATVTTLTISAVDYLSYYARFRAFFQGRPQYTKQGIERIVQFTLLEGDRTSP